MAEAGRFDAIVIGAGANGLVGAIVLARAGKRVLVLERAEAAGGMARAHEFAPGFRTAPLGLDAGWFPPAVARATGVRAPVRRFPEYPLGAITPSGSLLLPGDFTAAASMIRDHSRVDAGRWPRFAELIHKLSVFLAALYQMPSPDIDATGSADLISMLGIASRLRKLGRRDMVELLRVVPMSIQELLDDWFESPLLKATVAVSGVTGIRQGPRSGGTAFVLLHHQVGAQSGCFGPVANGYWDQGPDALVNDLAARAKAVGVEFRHGAEVARIGVSDERVTGVVLGNGDEYGAATVLSTADPARTVLGLVDPVWLDPDLLLAIRNIKYRGSRTVVSLALRETPSFPGFRTTFRPDGVISLSGALDFLERAADSAKYGAVSPRPMITLRVITGRWPGFAQTGQAVVVAEAQWTPFNLREGSWDSARRDQLTRTVIEAIAEVSPGLAEKVVASEILTPPDLAARYGMTEGAASHGELTLDQILFMRPVPALSRYATPITGLYLGGSGSHPGPGIEGAPGWLAARTILKGR
jgi:phytoene dehydrogenase-like protein